MSDPAAAQSYGFLHDIDGNHSSKRLFGAIALGCLVVTLVAILGGALIGHPVPDSTALHDLIEVFQFLVLGSIGGVAFEKWAGRRGPDRGGQ